MISYIPPEQEFIKPGENIMKRIGEKGLIIVGYQGIGKSSAASKRESIIDLKSSNFKVDGERDENWYVVYCRIAVSLARQGFTVLTSSHKCVVQELNKYDSNGNYSIVIICPHYTLKDLWVAKLHQRYVNVPSEKNENAWKDAEANFIEEIAWLATNSNFSHIFVKTMDYNFPAMIMGLRSMNRSRVNPLLADRTEGC